MLDGLQTYQILSSIKLHFQQKSYSVAKYGYNRNTFNLTAFEKRNEKYMYTKLGKNIDNPNHLVKLAAINLFYNPDLWVGDMMLDKANDRYLRFKSFNQSMMYYIMEDFKYLISKYGSFVLSLKNGGVVNEVTSEKIHPATYCIFDRIYNVGDVVTTHFGSNVVWDVLKQRLSKFDTFVSVPTIDFYDEVKYNCKSLVASKCN